VIAYLVTLVANTARISIALQMERTEVSWLNPAQLHRFEGVFIYFAFLLLLFVVSENIRPRKLLIFSRSPFSRFSCITQQRWGFRWQMAHTVGELISGALTFRTTDSLGNNSPTRRIPVLSRAPSPVGNHSPESMATERKETSSLCSSINQ